MRYGPDVELMPELIHEAEQENFLLVRFEAVRADVRVLNLHDPYDQAVPAASAFYVATQIPVQYLYRGYVPVKVKAAAQSPNGKVDFSYQWSDCYFYGQSDSGDWWKDSFPRNFTAGAVCFGSLRVGGDYSLVLEYASDNKGTVFRNGQTCSQFTARLKVDLVVGPPVHGAVVAENETLRFVPDLEDTYTGDYTYLAPDTQEVITCYAITKVYPWL